MLIIDPAIYRITSADRSNLVITLEKGIPKGNVIVEESIPLAPHQEWAVVYQSDELYTFKSQIKAFDGEPIDEARRPYARNIAGSYNEFVKLDPYIRGGEIDLYATFKIRVLPPSPEHPDVPLFTIGLPKRDPTTVWTIIDGGRNIILDEYESPGHPKKNQIWKFERIGDLRTLSQS